MLVDTPLEHAERHSPALFAMMVDIRRRLAPICANLSPALFTELVLQIARVQFKYDQAAHLHL